MSVLRIDILRSAILRTLEANDSRFGLDAEALAALLPASGFRVATSEVKEQLSWLVDNHFVRAVNRTLDPQRVAYLLTAEGRHQI